MNYTLIKDVLDLVQAFEQRERGKAAYEETVTGFRSWLMAGSKGEAAAVAPDWENKENGRSPESVISTLILHMSRYARAYSKAAIHGSGFSTQEDFIYLINLKAFGPLTKTALIKKNVQEKPAGMQIINRLLSAGWVEQTDSPKDKRSKVIGITAAGLAALDAQMDKIRQASRLVTGDLTQEEQLELIRLLTKLDDFHNPLYCLNLKPDALLEKALQHQNQPQTK